MTIFTHKVPANLVGISIPSTPTVVSGSYAVQDVEKSVYAMQGTTPVRVGWVAATYDGVGGIAELARGPDMSFNWQSSMTGFGATGNSSSVTVQYPAMNVLWRGSMQPIAAGSFTGVPSGSGTIPFFVSYRWGLTSFSIGPANQYSNMVEICLVSVTATSASILPSEVNGNWMGNYTIVRSTATTGTNLIPHSDANGNMSW